MLAEAAVQSIILWLFAIWFVGVIAGVVYWFWDTDAYRQRLGLIGHIWLWLFLFIVPLERALKGELSDWVWLSASLIVAMAALFISHRKTTNLKQPN